MSDASTTGLDALVATALAEDLGGDGDVTAQSVVGADASMTAAFVAREPGVCGGLRAAAAVYRRLDEQHGERVGFEARVADGDPLHAARTVAMVSGPARGVLAGERTALNLLTHLSGVATLTARYVEAVAGTGVAVRDTRKTTPGLRALEKAAVVAGGGANHRSGLYDAILVKDNHIALAGSVAEATARALAAASGRGLDCQIEVDDLDQLEEALAAGARSVLLDNFPLEAMRAAVARCRSLGEAVFVEASGGITLQTVRAIAATGVDAVAVGALTHSAPALDIGLDVVG